MYGPGMVSLRRDVGLTADLNRERACEKRKVFMATVQRTDFGVLDPDEDRPVDAI